MPMFGGAFGGNTQGAQSGMQNALLQAVASGQAQGALNTNYGNAKGEYATNYYDPYSQAGSGALGMYSNALGLNGPQGNQTAQNAFKVGPGYQFAMDQGIQALDRSAASKGMYGSGNNAIALTQYGQGLANQEYGNWLSGLSGLSNTGLTAAAGQTNRQGQLAGLDTGLGNSLASVITGQAQQGGKAIQDGQMADAASNAAGGANFISALLGGGNLGIGAYYGKPVGSK